MNKKLLFICVSAIFSLLLFTIISCSAQGNNGTNIKNLGNKGIPAFTPVGGLYKSAQSVTITSGKRNKIYYTTDGTTPTVDSIEYKDSFTVEESTFLRALSVSKDGAERYAMTMYDFDFTDDVTSHMESPVWTDQIIFFAMLDRFNNGDSSNDDQGFNENNVNEETWFSGGDFAGLEAGLDYIKNLGATAIWVTPPIKNQWTEGNFGGSHGYWASDFMKVDPHFGDYFNINGAPLTAGASLDDWELRPESLPFQSPEQLPWKYNDPKLFTEDELKNNSFYNWTPAISDFNDKSQLQTYQLSNLDDMNTKNPVVQNLLRGYFRYWIDKVDVDAYRCIECKKYYRLSGSRKTCYIC